MYVVIVGDERAKGAREVFEDAQRRIEESGYIACNPFEESDSGPESREFTDMALHMLADADVVFMTKGWLGSPVARMAEEYARLHSIAIYEDQISLWRNLPRFAPARKEERHEDDAEGQGA